MNIAVINSQGVIAIASFTWIEMHSTAIDNSRCSSVSGYPPPPLVSDYPRGYVETRFSVPEGYVETRFSVPGATLKLVSK